MEVYERKEYDHKFINNLILYISKLKSISGEYGDAFDNVDNCVVYIDKNITPNNEKDIKNMVDIFKYFHEVMKIYYIFNLLMGELKDLSSDKVINDDNLYDMEIQNMYNNIVIAYKVDKKNTNEFAVKYITNSSAIILEKINKDGEILLNQLSTTQKIFRTYYYSISLYVFIIQSIMNTYSENNDITNTVLSIVDSDKDFILSIDFTDFSDKKGTKYIENYNSTDLENTTSSNDAIPLSTFGLVSMDKYNTLTDVINKFFNTSVKDGKNSLLKVANSNKTSIILFNRHSNRSIYCDVSHMFKFDKNYRVVNNGGINIDVINSRGSIIKLGKAQKWKFNIKSYGDFKKYDKVLILESISSTKYRVLTPYIINDSTNVSLYFVKKNQINPLINHITNINKKKHISTRVDIYNNNKIHKAMPNLFVKYKMDVSDKYDSDISVIVEPKFLRESSKIKILEKYESLMSKKKVKNIHDYHSIIYDSSYADIFCDVLIKNFLDIDNFDDFFISELFLTYMSDLETNITIFNRTMHDNIINLKLQESMFSSKKNINSLNSMFSSCVSNTLGYLITNDGNIYQSMISKYKLIKINILNKK